MGEIEPEREFAAKDAATLAVAAAGDDLDAAEAFRIGLVKEGCERMEGPLSGLAMQVQGSIGLKSAISQLCPTAVIQPRGALAGGDQRQQERRLG